MKRFDFIKKIDYLFLFSILFFISFVILSYFIHNNLWCFFISFCCGYILYSLLTKVITARGNKVLCKKQDLVNIETLKTFMITCGTKNAINYLNTLVNGNIIENIIITTDSVYYLNTKSATLDLYSAAKISVTTTDKEKKLILISESVTEELINYLNNNGYKVSFITYADIYFKYIKDKKELPIINKKSITKNTLKSLFKLALSRKNSKGYFVNGIIIFLFSFLYPFQSYYLVFSLLLFSLALVSYFEPFKTISS